MSEVVSIKALRMFVTIVMALARDESIGVPSRGVKLKALQELAEWADLHEDATATEIEAAMEKCNAQMRGVAQAHTKDADEHH